MWRKHPRKPRSYGLWGRRFRLPTSAYCGAGTRACRVGTHADAWRTLHRTPQRQPHRFSFQHSCLPRPHSWGRMAEPAPIRTTSTSLPPQSVPGRDRPQLISTLAGPRTSRRFHPHLFPNSRKLELYENRHRPRHHQLRPGIHRRTRSRGPRFSAPPHLRDAPTGSRRTRRSRAARCPRSCSSKTGQPVGVYAREQGAIVPTRLVHSAKSWLSNPDVDRTAKILPWDSAGDRTRALARGGLGALHRQVPRRVGQAEGRRRSPNRTSSSPCRRPSTKRRASSP